MNKNHSMNEKSKDSFEKKGAQTGKPGLGKMDWKTAKRLLSYLEQYKFSLVVVVICILLSAVASVGVLIIYSDAD